MATVRPVSQFLPCDLHPVRRPSPSSPRSHYRPFSTLCTESPYIEIRDKPAARLIKLKRCSSVGGLHAFNNMGIHFKPKEPRLLPNKAAESFSTPNSRPSTPQCLAPMHVPRPCASSASLRPAPALHRVKKKRSMASLFSASDTVSDSATPSPLGTSPAWLPPQKPEHPPNYKYANTEHDIDISDRFVPKTIWAKRHNMKLHPYQEDAPYMQAYDPVLLESDRYTDFLLQRLSNGSPSFHEYGKKPPATILDLGCGQGNWILHAANVWKNSKFTGLDLVDVTLSAFETTENVQFVQGNFLRYKLPFPDKSFDYVRMANLVLCVPYDKWESLFAEVRRVLTTGGRLEMIDDQIYFPYGETPKDPPSSSPNSLFDDFDDDGFDEDDDTLHGEESGDTASTLLGEGGSSPSSFEAKGSQLSESATIRPFTPYLPPTPVSAIPSEPAVFRTKLPYCTRDSRQATWQRQAFASRDLEIVFEIMLRVRFGIFARPSEFVLDTLKNVFGKGNAGKTRSFHIKLAPVDSPIGTMGASVRRVDNERERGEDGANMKSTGTFHDSGFSVKKKAWMPGMDWEKQQKKRKEKKAAAAAAAAFVGKKVGDYSGSSSERSSLETPTTGLGLLSTPLPAGVNAKAAGRLGLDYQLPVNSTTGSGNGISPPRDTTAFDALLPPSPTTAKPMVIYSTAKPMPPTATTARVILPSLTPTLASSSSSTQLQQPVPVLSAKAAGRLGISYSALAAATASSARNQHALINPSASFVKPKPPSGPVQSPGLLVWPTTYIAMGAAELEMHACKYVHTLLGCRPAIAEFVGRYVDEEGRRYVQDWEFEEAVWEYECFRRSRFDWPSEIADPYEDDATNASGLGFSSPITGASITTTTTISSSTSIMPDPPLLLKATSSSSSTASKSSKSASNSTHSRNSSSDSFNGQYQRDELTHIRTIRVFEATKVEEGPGGLVGLFVNVQRTTKA